MERMEDQLKAAQELKAAAEAKATTLLDREAKLKETLDAEVCVCVCVSAGGGVGARHGAWWVRWPSRARAPNPGRLTTPLRTRIDVGGVQHEARTEAESRKVDAEQLLEQTQQDLRKEAEIAASLEKAKAALERQVKELRDKLEDVELGKAAGAQRTVMRLESRVEELQARLQAESTARANAIKDKRSAERELSELHLKAEELSKEKTVLEDQSRKSEARLKTLRTQLSQSVRQRCGRASISLCLSTPRYLGGPARC